MDIWTALQRILNDPNLPRCAKELALALASAHAWEGQNYGRYAYHCHERARFWRDRTPHEYHNLLPHLHP